jgi:hypothetical protein
MITVHSTALEKSLLRLFGILIILLLIFGSELHGELVAGQLAALLATSSIVSFVISECQENVGDGSIWIPKSGQVSSASLSIAPIRGTAPASQKTLVSGLRKKRMLECRDFRKTNT